MDVFILVVAEVAVHVLIIFPLDVVMLGMVALHRYQYGVQGEVKAHPATSGVEAVREGLYRPCCFFLLVSRTLVASVFGTVLFPLGLAVLPVEVLPSALPEGSVSSSESDNSSISISGAGGPGGVTATAIPCSVRICMKAAASVAGEASCQTLLILP